MNALIIYDNLACASMASTILQRASDNPTATIRWNVRPWPVDALNTARNADEALLDAVDSHLIVFAGHRAQSVPSWLLNWLERWAACRQIQDAAFAVIGGGTGQTLSMRATPELSRFAKRHGLNFITGEAGIVSDGQEYRAQPEPKNELSPPPVQLRYIEAPAGPGYRDWGIND